MSEPSSKDDICGCSHFRFRHQYESEDGPCSKPDCDCKAYAPVLVEDVELPCPHESWEVRSEWRDEGTGKWWKSRRCTDCGEGLDNIPTGDQHGDRCANKGGCVHLLTDRCEHGCALSRKAREAEGSVLFQKHEEPKPEPRPPYAVAYSVEGQLYEAYIPGDAAVIAMNGALVIEHNGKAVSGIVQVLPVRQEK